MTRTAQQSQQVASVARRARSSAFHEDKEMMASIADQKHAIW